jgi:serine/threonine protein kinase
MTSERWRQVEALFNAALEQKSDRRERFLAEACRGDKELRQEVESLLGQGGSNEGVLDRPAWEAVPSLIEYPTSLTPGMQLGPYKILAPLGAGGMGEVYRAKDTKLKREVALKVLPDSFANDPERMARFEREAKVLASLNHPNIAQVYGVEERALVMELVPGETLKGPLPLPTALNYAKQIAEALEAAHEKGIIHRDVKPGNVKVTPEGVVKLLDFGLAKAAEESTDPNDATNSPTLTAATRAGMILGTAAYMSPEQASGKSVDRRADIWSFGVVLWELLTGHRLFEGETVTQTLAEVLRGPIDFDHLPRETPAEIRRLLHRCLDRNVKNRLRDIGEARIAIETALAGETPLLEGALGLGDARQLWLAWSVAAVATVSLAAVGYLHFREKPPDPSTLPELALSIVPPSGRNLDPVGGLYVDTISPDGSTVLYRATDGRFHIRRLSSLQDQFMPPFASYGDPFWAPDSKSIAFQTVSGLMKMRVPNGSPELVTAPAAPRGGSWGDKGIILCASFDSSPGGIGLYGVPAAGGQAFHIEVSGLKDGRYYKPEFLPGGDDFLFVFIPSGSAEAQLFLATLRGGKAVDPRLLFSNDTAAAFTSAGGGHILFVRNDNLYGQKLDVKGRHLIGAPELIQEQVASNAELRVAYFSVSSSGTVVWRSGTAVTSQVTVFDRKGNRIGTAGASVPAEYIRLAPDDAHILVTSEAGVWVMEANGPGRTSLAPGLVRLWSLWSPDGSGVIGVRGTEIYQQSVSGSHEIRPFPGFPALGMHPKLLDISEDGKRILYGEGNSLRSFSLDGERRSEQVVEQQVDRADMSPDGAWTVYIPLTEPGIYVQPLTSPGLRRQIANSGGRAVWRKDGKEIMYSQQGRIWSVRVDGVGTQLRFAAPESLFSVAMPLGLLSGARPLAVSRDGARIYFLQSAEEPDSGVIHVRTRAIR